MTREDMKDRIGQACSEIIEQLIKANILSSISTKIAIMSTKR